jgi:hypothetical protein
MEKPGRRSIEMTAAVATRGHARDIRHAEMVVVGTYATAGAMSVSSHRRCQSDRHPGGPETVNAKETNMIILLPLLRRLSARTRLAVGLALTTVGLFLIIAALAHGVIAVIVGAVFLVSVYRERQRERLTYPSR